VRAVLPLDVEQRFDPIGEHRVVPPDRDGQGLLVQQVAGRGVAQPDDQPGGHRLLGANAA